MKNYKQALYNAIKESTNTEKEYLNDYAIEFIDNVYIGSQYICDAISEFANSNASKG